MISESNVLLKLSLVHLWICVSQSRQQQNSSRTWIGFSSNIFYWNQISLILKLEKSRWQSLEVWQTPKQAITIFLNSSFYFVLRQKKRSTDRTLLLSSFDNIYLLSNQLFSDFVFQCCWMASTWTRTSRIRSDDYLETSRLWKIHHGKLQEVHVQSSSQYSSTIKQQPLL